MATETLEEYRKRVASAGGRGRAKKLSPKQRTASARKAARARWAQAKVERP